MASGDLDPISPQGEFTPAISPAGPEEISLVEPPPRLPHPNFWWALLWCVAFMLVTQVFAGILAVIGVAAVDVVRRGGFVEMIKKLPAGSSEQSADARQEAMKRLQSEIMAPALTLSQILVIGFSLCVLRLVVGRDWTRQIGLRRPAMKHIALALAGLPALSILGGAIGELAARHLPSFKDAGMDVESQVKEMAHLPLFFLILMIGVGPGIGEELWFRGFLGRGLVGNYGVVIGVLITSLFFGAMHVDPPQAVGAAVLGIGLHLVYLATRSLWVPMLLHFLNNSTAVFALTHPDWGLGEVDGGPGFPEHFVAVIYYGAAVALLLSVGWALYRSRTRVLSMPNAPHTWQPDYPGVEYPPPGTHGVLVRRGPGWFAVALVLGALIAFFAAGFLPTAIGHAGK